MSFARTKTLLRDVLRVGGLLPVLRYMRRTQPVPITDAEVPPAVTVVPPVTAVVEVGEPPAPAEPDYEARIATEIKNFADDQVVHGLPQIFHYWSNKYLLAKIEPFGFRHPDDFYTKHFAARMTAPGFDGTYKFISIGAGNCDTEVRIAKALLAEGHESFSIECLELNPAMVERGRAYALEQGVSQYVHPVVGDFNLWKPDKPYHAVMANQSLHHVLNLEGLFDSISEAIRDFNGTLVTSDMIGRNGHLRWPEALEIVEEYWQRLAPRYRYDRQLRRQEDAFVNWDCSVEGFEGIRAQDILPLMVDRFHFDLFVPFANIISPFIDRSFGPNFEIDAPEDRALIDEIHERDEREMLAGTITPTQMFAVLSLDYTRPSRIVPGMQPEFCIRRAVD